MYFHGLCVPQNYADALMWFHKAAEQGNAAASELRDWLAERMTPLQVAEAERPAREWLAKHPQ